MKVLRCLFVFLATVASSLTVAAAPIPTFQVGGSHSDNTINGGFTITPVSTPDGNGGYTYEYTVTFLPATLTVTQLYNVGNSGLAISDNLAFAGGSITAPLFSNDYVPFGDVAWALYAPAVLPSLPFTPAVPEPSTLVIFGFGAIAVAYRTRRKNQA